MVLLLFHLPECQEFQEDALKTHVVVQAQSPAAGEGSSVSEYFTCVSNSSQLLPLAKDGKADAKMGSELGYELLT
jgi:hypothetical protein